MKTSLTVRVLAALLLVILPAPLVIVIGASFSPVAILTFPPHGFSLRWYSAVLGQEDWISAFLASVAIAVVAAIVTTLVALGAALSLEGASRRVRSLVETLILAPLLFPTAALGIAFLSVFVTVRLNGSMLSVFVAHVVLCAPFAYRPIAVSLRQIDQSVSEAAMILGASAGRAITSVLIPMLRPGISAALMFAFIISFDEVTVTMFLTGPDFTTLPVKIYNHLADSADPVVAAISTILIVMTSGIILVLDRVVGLSIFVDIEEDVRG